MKVEQIAAEMGVAKATILRECSRLGLEPRRRGPNRVTIDEAVLRRMWLDPGASRTAIAQDLGVSEQALGRFADKIGLPPRRRVKARCTAQIKPAAPRPSQDPILATKGKYRALAKLGAVRGVSHAAMLQAWHKARAAARCGRPASAEVSP